MPEPQDLTVLIVDDEEDVVGFLATVLEDAGFNVLTACDGEEAMARVREKTPDLISLDLVMPEMSGVRFYHELRKNPAWARIPVLVVTGHARGESGRADLEGIVKAMTLSGPASFFEKPIKAEKFLKTVKAELGL